MAGADAKDNTGSEWRVVEEPLKLSSGELSLKFTNTVLKRDSDGLEVRCRNTGHPESMRDHFLFKGDFGELEVTASRMGPELYQIADRYIVQLNSTFLNPPALALAKSLAKDIASALLNYPTNRLYDFIPVKDIVFDVSPAIQPIKLVTLEKLSNG